MMITTTAAAAMVMIIKLPAQRAGDDRRGSDRED